MEPNNSNNLNQPQPNVPNGPVASGKPKMPQQLPEKDKQKMLVIILGSLAGVLLIVVIVLVVLITSSYSQSSTNISKKNQEIKDLNAKVQSLESGFNEGFTIINELGLEYPDNQNNRDIVYIIDNKSPNKPVMYLSTKPLMTAQLEASRLVPAPDKNACSPADGAAGKITRYTVSDKINGKPVTELVGNGVVKLGNFYYAYDKSTSVCSLNQNVQKLQQQANDQAQTFFKSLKTRAESK